MTPAQAFTSPAHHRLASAPSRAGMNRQSIFPTKILIDALVFIFIVPKGIKVGLTGRQILTELLKPDLYTPKGNEGILLKLYRGPDGLFLGHAHGANGKIVGHARWLKVTGTSSRLLSSAGMLTGQLMLVEMSQKLDRIQGSIDAIRKALDDDRMQKLRAAIGGAKDAVEAKGVHNRYLLLTSTIPHLSEAILQTIAALKREIAEIPLPPDWQITRVIIDRESQMRESIAKAEKTFHACDIRSQSDVCCY